MVKCNIKNVVNLVSKSKLPSADFVINPYVGCTHGCIYCYAEFMKRFTNHKEPWGGFLDVKSCDKPINPRIYDGKTMLIGSVTDPYNPFEKQYEVTRKILYALQPTSARVEILTKSPLILRDIDILSKFSDLHVGISLNTTNDSFRKKIELFTCSVEQRLDTIKQLAKSNIKTYLFLSPIFPELSDWNDLVDIVKDDVEYICFENLNLRSSYKGAVMNMIAKNTKYINIYNDIYNNNNLDYWKSVRSNIISKCERDNIEYKIYFHHD